MANLQQESPITFNDLLNVEERTVGEQPITKEDAALMESLEHMAFRHIPKGSAASVMQSAADHNIAVGAVRSDAHGFAAEQGMCIKQNPTLGSPTQKECMGYSEQGVSIRRGSKPSNFTKNGECVEYVAGHPIPAPLAKMPPANVPTETEHEPSEPIARIKSPGSSDMGGSAPSTTINKITDESGDKSDASMVAMPKPTTIGQALEAASVSAGHSQLEQGDVKAIQSAESRATGKNIEKEGLAATVQSALETSGRIGSTPTTKVTVADVLTGATEELHVDKVVTDEDAAKVRESEKRGRVLGDVKTGGVAECMQAAAERNK